MENVRVAALVHVSDWEAWTHTVAPLIDGLQPRRLQVNARSAAWRKVVRRRFPSATVTKYRGSDAHVFMRQLRHCDADDVDYVLKLHTAPAVSAVAAAVVQAAPLLPSLPSALSFGTLSADAALCSTGDASADVVDELRACIGDGDGDGENDDNRYTDDVDWALETAQVDANFLERHDQQLRVAYGRRYEWCARARSGLQSWWSVYGKAAYGTWVRDTVRPLAAAWSTRSGSGRRRCSGAGTRTLRETDVQWDTGGIFWLNARQATTVATSSAFGTRSNRLLRYLSRDAVLALLAVVLHRDADGALALPLSCLASLARPPPFLTVARTSRTLAVVAVPVVEIAPIVAYVEELLRCFDDVWIVVAAAADEQVLRDALHDVDRVQICRNDDNDDDKNVPFGAYASALRTCGDAYAWVLLTDCTHCRIAAPLAPVVANQCGDDCADAWSLTDTYVKQRTSPPQHTLHMYFLVLNAAAQRAALDHFQQRQQRRSCTERSLSRSFVEAGLRTRAVFSVSEHADGDAKRLCRRRWYETLPDVPLRRVK